MAKNDLHLNNLYLRYLFNRDVGDISRANYWLSRIKEYEQLNNIKNEKSNTKTKS